jgi:hypothetical protein
MGFSEKWLVGLERGALTLVRIIEERLQGKVVVLA